MGLDHYIQRRFLPEEPEDMNEKILVELEDQEKDEAEDVFEWRKDYKLHNFVFTEIGEYENCEELKLTKEDLIKLLEYFKANNGSPAEQFDHALDYTKEISQLNDILEYDDLTKVEYFYYAWW